MCLIKFNDLYKLCNRCDCSDLTIDKVLLRYSGEDDNKKHTETHFWMLRGKFHSAVERNVCMCAMCTPVMAND